MSWRSLWWQSAAQISPRRYDQFSAGLLRPIHDVLIERAARRFAGAWILDFGCGPGRLALRLAREVPRARVDAVDRSDHMVMYAEDQQADAGGDRGVRFGWRSGPGHHPFERSAYDLVIVSLVLHTTDEDPVQVLGELHGCLEPGGELWLLECNGAADVADRPLAAALAGGTSALRQGLSRAAIRSYRRLLRSPAGWEEVLRDSPFGTVPERDFLALSLAGRTIPDFFVWWRARKPEIHAILDD